VRNPDMLYLAVGIIGATVMPHNLYLHSGVVQTRRFGESVEDRREAIKLAGQFEISCPACSELGWL